MWTKLGVGHGLGHSVSHGIPLGLPYGQPYGLPVVRISHTSRPRILRSRQVSKGLGKRQKLRLSLHGMNKPQRPEIRESCFIIIPLSYDSSLKVVFIRHSGLSGSDLAGVGSENLNERPPRG